MREPGGFRGIASLTTHRIMQKHLFAGCLVLSLSVLAAFTGRASAAPVNYIESIHGDLSWSDPLDHFTFDVGLNTIVGTTGIVSVLYDLDSFAFTVPDGLQVTSLRIILDDHQGNAEAAIWDIYVGSDLLGGGASGERLEAFSPGSVDATSVPLGPGVYNMSAFGFLSGGAPAPVTIHYTFIFDVHPIPEPATAALLIPLLALTRRRPRMR